MKVYELAKELGLKSVELLDRIKKDSKLTVKNHMQTLSKENVATIRKLFEKKKPASAIKKKPAVVRKKSKTTTVSKAIKKEPKPELSVAKTASEPPPSPAGIIRRKKKVAEKPVLQTEKEEIVSSETSSVTKTEKKEIVQSHDVTRSHHIRPGLVAGETQTDILLKRQGEGEFEEESKKKTKKTGLEKENQSQQFRATDFRKREVIFQPKKKRVSSSVSAKKTLITVPKAHKRQVKMHRSVISLEEIAKAMGVKQKILVKKIRSANLFSKDIPINLDYDSAILVADLFQFEVKNMMKSQKEMIESFFFGSLDAEKKVKTPVVTVMGHVNHGKTTLLDYIRKSKVASTETGGITQHIGAYSVPVKDRQVTFIDTPGHSAFANMRARGAQVTDIVILVVSAVDGLQPQTIEAIGHAKQTNTPIIVAVNKIDLPTANIEQTKKQLMEKGLVPEDWGGDTIFCSISALKGEGIKELLENILLLAEVNELKANPLRSAMGVIIESRLEKGRGWVMTLLVQDGTLHSGEVLMAGNQVGKVRQMTNDMGKMVKTAEPGCPVEISGFSGPAQAGDFFYAVKDEKAARLFVAEYSDQKQKKEEESEQELSMEELFLKAHKKSVKTLNVVLKTDVDGSLEAIRLSLESLKTKEVEVKIVHSDLGLVNESDVLLAKTAGAVLLCFNVAIDSKAQGMVKKESIMVKSYKVIYDLLTEVEAMMAELLDPDIKQTLRGKAEVLQVFPISKTGLIAGCKVISGKIGGSEQAKLIRESEVIYTGKISSLRRFKQDAKEVVEGQECGIVLDQNKDIKPGDIIESFTQEVIKKTKLERKTLDPK